MPPRTRPSTRQAARPASSASDAPPSTEPRTRTKRASSDHPPASEPPLRRTRQRVQSNDESEESARLPGRRGKAKPKHKTPLSKVAQTHSTIEEDAEEEGEEEIEEDTQGTIHLASREADRSVSSEVAPEDFADAPEVPEERDTHPAPPSPALSGTTARVSDVRFEMPEPVTEVQNLSRLWTSAWKCINKLVPRHLKDEQLGEHHRQFRNKSSKTGLELRPMCDEFRKTFSLYTSGYLMDVPEKVSALAGAPGRSVSLLPNERRTDEILFMANIAMQIIDVAGDPQNAAGLSWETFTQFEETFPSFFVRGLGDEVGETSSTIKGLVDLAVSWREQAILGIITEKYPEVTCEQVVIQLYYTEDEKALRGWDTPGMHDEDITGGIKIALTESAQKFQSIMSSQGEAGYTELKAALENAFPPEGFRRKLLRWNRRRARELRDAFDHRLDGDVDALQRELLRNTDKAAPQSETIAPVQGSRSTDGAETKPPRTKKKSRQKSTEFWQAMKKANEEPFKQPDRTRTGAKVLTLPAAGEIGNISTGNHTSTAVAQAHDDDDTFPVNNDDDAEDGRRDTPPSYGIDANGPRDERSGRERVPSSQMIADHFPRGISSRIENPKIRKRAFNKPQAGARVETWNGELDSQASTSRSDDRYRATSLGTRRTQQGIGGKRKPDTDGDDEDDDFETDTRQMPRKDRGVGRNGSAQVGMKRTRDADTDREATEPQSKRQRGGLDSRRDETARVSSFSTVREDVEDWVPSSTRAMPNEGRQRGEAKLSWDDEEDQVLLDGVEEFRGDKLRMPKILDPDFDRLEILRSRGRKNADLTNRARILKAQMIRNARSVDDGLRGRPGLTEIPLKPDQLKKLMGAGIDVKDLPESRKFFE